MAKLSIDHVTIAGPSLRDLEQSFEAIGMTSEYGGAHSNGVTHMSLVGFDDGSYIELISVINPGQRSPWWHQHIENSAGPCGWAIQQDGLAAEAERIAKLGVSVRGPFHMQRDRPDGQLVEWDLAFLGDGEPGTSLPFLICDRTPRDLRVRPSASVSGGRLVGVDTVVVGVRDLEKAISLWKQVFALDASQIERCETPAATIATYPSAPIALASCISQDDWLAERCRQFGDCPCAYLIATTDLDSSMAKLPVARVSDWFARRVALIDPARLMGIYVGLIQCH